jgi:hypothetical protein
MSSLGFVWFFFYILANLAADLSNCDSTLDKNLGKPGY